MRWRTWSGVAEHVAGVAVLGDHAQRLLLAAAADEDGRAAGLHGLGHVERVRDLEPLAVEGGGVVHEHALRDLEALLELLEAVGERAELEAVLVVLLLEPAGADAPDGSAAWR